MGVVTKLEMIENASVELRALRDSHPELRRAEVQEVMQAWTDAQSNDASPEVLCARLVKAMIDVSAFLGSASQPVPAADLRTALRAALGMPDTRPPTRT